MYVRYVFILCTYILPVEKEIILKDALCIRVIIHLFSYIAETNFADEVS
jgi:hypothetical protein